MILIPIAIIAFLIFALTTGARQHRQIEEFLAKQDKTTNPHPRTEEEENV